MRQTFSLVFLLMAIALAMCAYLALRSRKAIGKHVAQTVAALIPPVIGNMIIIGSGTKASSTLGCYIYFLGMDLVMLALTGFTLEYCHLPNLKAKYLTTVRALLAVDAVQLLLNPLFGHAFDTEAIPVDGFAYYRLVPRLGQTFHRVVDYGILATVIVIFIYKLIRTPRIYAERYGIILAAILVGLVWETYYIFSRTPIDRSMVSFGVFGLLVFYFSIYYRPVRLLDRMLANIASEMPEAMFFLDVTGHCVWANRPGQRLAELGEGEFDSATERLRAMFDISLESLDEWSVQRQVAADDGVRHYVLQKHALSDDRGRLLGAFLSVRDDTREHQALQREKYNATHDRLTGLYNREYLYERIRQMTPAGTPAGWWHSSTSRTSSWSTTSSARPSATTPSAPSARGSPAPCRRAASTGAWRGTPSARACPGTPSTRPHWRPACPASWWRTARWRTAY